MIKPKHNIGDKVYLKTDPSQQERLVVSINVFQGGMSYTLTCGLQESVHYDFEIIQDRDVMKFFNN